MRQYHVKLHFISKRKLFCLWYVAMAGSSRRKISPFLQVGLFWSRGKSGIREWGMPWAGVMSWLKKEIGSPKPVILKSNSYQKGMFEKFGFSMGTILSIILCKLLWRVMLIVIVSLMPTIWRPMPRNLTPNGLIKAGLVIAKKKGSIALSCRSYR